MDIAERAEDAGKTSTSFTLIANYAFSTCKLLLDCVPLDGSALPPSPTPADYRRASLFAGGLPVLSVYVHFIPLLYLSPGHVNTPLHDSILRQTSDLLDLGLSEEKRGVTEAALETITACIGELVFHLEQFKEIEGSESNVDRSEHDVSFPKGPSIPDVDAEEGFGVAMGSRSRIHDSGGAAPSVLESPPADREVSQFYYRPSSLGLSAGGDGGKNLILLNNEAQRLGLGVGWVSLAALTSRLIISTRAQPKYRKTRRPWAQTIQQYGLRL